MKITKLIVLASAGFLFFSNEAEAQSDNSKYLRDSMPQTWQMTQQCYQTLPTDDSWWKTFNDPVLDSLISRAVANNYNVAAAIKRIDMAGKAIKEVQAAYFPTLSAAVGWNLDRQSGATVKPPVHTSQTSSFSLGATMNWEIDVFGRVKANANSKKAAYNVARADYDAVMVSLCANVATAYLQLRTCQEQLSVATAHIESQERVMKITEARYEADLGDMLDVTQARIVLYGTQSTLPALNAQIRTLMNAISLLLGEYPDSLVTSLETISPMPDYRQVVAVGLPTDLLRRRPDIVEAEFQLAEYAANIGVAKKDFLPALSLTGSIGTSAHNVDGLFGKHSLTYSVAPQLSWTIFDGLARNYRTSEAKLQFEAAIDDYNLTVLNAVKEVDNALLEYNATLEAIELQKKVVNESKKSLDLSVDLYKSGLTAFSNVVDGQMNWLESQNSLVELEGKALSTLVTLYQALGGGWQY